MSLMMICPLENLWFNFYLISQYCIENCDWCSFPLLTNRNSCIINQNVKNKSKTILDITDHMLSVFISPVCMSVNNRYQTKFPDNFYKNDHLNNLLKPIFLYLFQLKIIKVLPIDIIFSYYLWCFNFLLSLFHVFCLFLSKD
jgi:hypothetical protein